MIPETRSPRFSDKPLTLADTAPGPTAALPLAGQGTSTKVQVGLAQHSTKRMTPPRFAVRNVEPTSFV